MFLLDDTPLAIEILDIVEPSDAVGCPNVGGFEAILLIMKGAFLATERNITIIELVDNTPLTRHQT